MKRERGGGGGGHGGVFDRRGMNVVATDVRGVCAKGGV